MKRLLLTIFVFFFLSGFSYADFNLSDEDRAVLNHVVVDADAWVEHALNYPKGGEKAVRAKIKRYRADYLAKKDLPGYMNRAERDAIENLIPEPTKEQLYEAAIKVKEAEILRRQAIAELEAEKL